MFKFSTLILTSFVGVIFLFVSHLQSVDGLKCWECDGYDETIHQCSPENSGKSVECTGPNPVCELVKEEYAPGDKLHGTVYFLRKCASVSSLVVKVGHCVPPQPGSTTLQTYCYCNDGDDCNRKSIAGVGEGSSPSKSLSPSQATTEKGSSGKKNGATFHSVDKLIIFIAICGLTFMY